MTIQWETDWDAGPDTDGIRAGMSLTPELTVLVKRAAYGDQEAWLEIIADLGVAKDAFAEIERLLADVRGQLIAANADPDGHDPEWVALTARFEGKIRALGVLLRRAVSRLNVEDAANRHAEALARKAAKVSAVESEREAVQSARAARRAAALQADAVGVPFSPKHHDLDPQSPLWRVAVGSALLSRGIGKTRNGDEWDWSTIEALIDEAPDDQTPITDALCVLLDTARRLLAADGF